MTSAFKPVAAAFEMETVLVPISAITPLKAMRETTKDSAKYRQIVTSIKAIGLVEPPVVTPDPSRAGAYFLLDGHVRIEALKDLSACEVHCLISTDDEAYTYNKHINRLSPIQEHRMVRRAIDRGVPQERLAEALGLDITSIHRRIYLLDGICDAAADILKNADCPYTVYDTLRRMVPPRQVEAAGLMVGQSNFSRAFGMALLHATPDSGLVRPRRRASSTGATREKVAQLERELSSLQGQIRSVEETYGVDNLHLTVAKGYLTKLLGNARVVGWLARTCPDYLAEFQAISEMTEIAPQTAR